MSPTARQGDHSVALPLASVFRFGRLRGGHRMRAELVSRILEHQLRGRVETIREKRGVSIAVPTVGGRSYLQSCGVRFGCGREA
jgi:hypothetical protein